jgi:hypothetical protein
VSTGLSYRILNNGNAVITGRGECTDKNIVIPDEIDGHIVAAIETNAFRYDKDLYSIQIANTVIHIGDTAFYECKNLKYLLVCEETYAVGYHAFACCNKLEQIVLGRVGQLDWFGDERFYGCNNIKNIEISRRGYCDSKVSKN